MLKQTSKPSPTDTPKQQGTNIRRVNGTKYFKEKELEPILIEVLRNFGGSASKKAIEYEIERRLQDEFTPADFKRVGEGIPRWKKNVQFNRLHLVKRGIMKEGSRRGIWELSESSHVEIS